MMNKARRKEIESARKKLEDAVNLVDEAQAALQQAMEEEQEYYDNMPEGLQSGEKGENSQAAISALETAIDNCGDLQEAVSACEEAEGY